MSDEAACSAERCPAASAGMGIVVGSFPRELRAGRTVARAVADVEIRLDDAENQLAVILAGEGDVRGLEEINLFPLIHLGDPPAPCEGPGEGRGAPGQVVAAISFGARTRL